MIAIWIDEHISFFWHFADSWKGKDFYKIAYFYILDILNEQK